MSIRMNLQELKTLVKEVLNESKKTDKSEKWIQKAIKKPGALKKSLHKKEDDTISTSEIDSEIQRLKKKDKDPKKKGVQGLPKKELTKFKRLNLAKTLRKLKENHEMEHEEDSDESGHYMFFSNLQTIKKHIDMLLDMDESEVKEILSNGHDWAADHIATSKDDISEVCDFLCNELGSNEEDDNSNKIRYNDLKGIIKETLKEEIQKKKI